MTIAFNAAGVDPQTYHAPDKAGIDLLLSSRRGSTRSVVANLVVDLVVALGAIATPRIRLLTTREPRP